MEMDWAPEFHTLLCCAHILDQVLVDNIVLIILITGVHIEFIFQTSRESAGMAGDGP